MENHLVAQRYATIGEKALQNATENATIRSWVSTAGVMVSPTTYAVKPVCIKRIAKDFATSPDRPAPIT